MAATPDVRPVGDLPNEIGKTAARELSLNGITSLEQVARHSREDLLAIHGVGPKAIRILDEALATTTSAMMRKPFTHAVSRTHRFESCSGHPRRLGLRSRDGRA
jgi:hypothetical protein